MSIPNTQPETAQGLAYRLAIPLELAARLLAVEARVAALEKEKAPHLRKREVR
jgi:hypothetical protein